MDTITKKTFWDYAGIAGLLMGMISSACMFIGQFLSTLQMSAVMTTVLGGFLWLAETVGCIGLMYFYMKKLSAQFPEENIKTIYRFGMASAFLSALLYAAVTFANFAYISADYYAEQFAILMQNAAPSLDSNSKAVMEKILTNIPQISFFGNLIYCTLFGSVVSSIISRVIINGGRSSEN